MCGRFAVATTEDAVLDEFDIHRVIREFRPSYNVAPTQQSPVVLREGGANVMDALKWGLIPSWAKDPAIGNRMINARAETAAEKPSFRAAFKSRRCLVVATGFFEWKKEQEKKTPFYVRLKSGRPFGFAGLWETWAPRGDEPVHTFTILTCGANALTHAIHDRMPVIIPGGKRALWLDADAKKNALLALLAPYPPDEMEAYEVSRLVNSPANNSPDCLKPLPGPSDADAGAS